MNLPEIGSRSPAGGQQPTLVTIHRRIRPDGSGQPIVANELEKAVVAAPSAVDAPSEDVPEQFASACVPPETFAEQGLLG